MNLSSIPIRRAVPACLVAAAFAVAIVGCSSSDVGSAPSSKSQTAEYFAREGAQSKEKQGAGPRRGKGGPGPQSIKKKLFTSDAPKSE